MPAKEMDIRKIGSIIELKRDQWQGKVAYISDYPNLLDAVKEYTWTYTAGEHPYLRCGKTSKSLHEFVLNFLYGEEYVQKMKDAGNIIEHLDNDGLNCTFENLHIVSSDDNKGKAFMIDKKNKDADEIDDFPAFVTDVYYSHEGKYFQMQLFVNERIYYIDGLPVESFIIQYDDFESLFIDWIYILGCREKRIFDISKFHGSKVVFKISPIITLTPEEQNRPFIMRNGEYYLNLDARGEDGTPLGFISHTSYRPIENKE